MSTANDAHVHRGGHRPCSPRGKGGFTLTEILIVVVILGLLAVIVVAQFSTAKEDADESAIEMQMSRIRGQIEYYRAQNLADPDLLGTQWNDMVAGDYLQQDPVNILNGSTVVAGAPGAGVGWVWRDGGTGSFDLYATDESGLAEFTE
jgi:prepilin-type N-terminal cleavage/methylation domain-containing protein